MIKNESVFGVGIDNSHQAGDFGIFLVLDFHELEIFGWFFGVQPGAILINEPMAIVVNLFLVGI
jgi:hypothetical protein